MTRGRIVIAVLAVLVAVLGTLVFSRLRDRRAHIHSVPSADARPSGQDDPMAWWDWSKAESFITVARQKDIPKLHLAAGRGDLKEVARLLKSGAQVNSRDRDGWTPLHWAAYEGQTDIVKHLLDHGVNRAARTTDPGELKWLLNTDAIGPHPIEDWYTIHKWVNATPLEAALAKGRGGAAGLLLDPGMTQARKDELLFWTAKWGYAGGVAIMLAHGANAKAKDKADWTPLHWAARQGTPDSVRALLRAGAALDARAGSQYLGGHYRGGTTPGQTALHLAAGKPDVAQLLIAAGADVNAQNEKGETPLHLAGGAVGPTKLLLAYGAEVNARDKEGRTPLVEAMSYLETSARDVLLAAGADINARDAKGNTPLFHALGYGTTDIAVWLLDHGADPNARNKQGQTPLHRIAAICWPNGVDYAKLLLSRGTSLDAKDGNGRTALEVATRKGNREVAVFLRDQTTGAAGTAGSRALHDAAARGDLVALQALLAKGTSVNSQDTLGLTPLHEAVAEGKRDAVKLLLSRKADPNVADRAGWTPLHKAAWDGDTDIARLLLAAGAKVNACMKTGDTPLHFAARRVHLPMAKLLLEKGADPNAEGTDFETPTDCAWMASGEDDGVTDSDEPAMQIADLLRQHGAKEY